MIFFRKNTAFQKATLFVVFFFCVQFLYSKENFFKFYNHPEYDNVLHECDSLIKTKKLDEYELGLEKLNTLEKTLINQKDFKDLGVLYLNISSIYYTSSDLVSTFKYLDKGMLVLKKHPNNEIMGFYCENYGVSYSLIGNHKKAKEYLLKSKYFLEKYVPVGSRLDLYYNLCMTSSREKDWENIIKYGNLHVSLNEKYFNVPSHPNLFLVIGKAYLNLNKIDEAKKILRRVENLSQFKKNENKALFNYYELLADVATAEKKHEEAGKYYKKALKYRDDFNREIFDKFKNSTQLENQALQSNFQLEREKANSQFKNSILIYLLISLGLLILLVFLQFRYTKDKTKTNELLNKKNEQLNELLAIKNKFLNTIAHDLRTPLNAITSILYLFKEKYNKIEKENLTILEHSTDQLINLSNNIIEYNVLSNNKDLALKPTKNNLIELITNIVTSFKKDISNNNEIYFDYDKRIENVLWFDKSRLTQVLNNLIDNAIKFTENGRITIKIILLDSNSENDFQTIRFHIEDEGIGIDDKIKEEIFELFFQGSDEISIKYGGSGIGLSLVKKTLDLLKSKLHIESKPVGTILYFDLKLKVVESTKVIRNFVKKDILCDKYNILVVEDNKINQILVQKILVSKGFNVDIAENGLQAIEKVKLNDYCLVLMDIMMPIMDGFEASEEIGKLKPDLPIVALTAVSEELNKEKFEKVHIRKVLNKPINVDDLSNTVNFYCVA
ncbi:response regulator [Flavobacterium terrigena]|uniref:histidine kinase n=2 Tax=Flavobacterium terrigena TaxID=402734 RepID=A0A1H6Y286_9FLAO|nr:response regulator [Flavobacterium terrigena]SEJ35423.1 Signal transduction histidine kinase [Flavobacterium terrigena]